DDRVLQWLLAGFKQQYNVDLSTDRYALQKTKDAAEKAKNTFSEADQANIHVPLVFTDAEGMSYDLETALTRQQFNHMVMELVQRTFKVCDEALQTARLTASDVDGVIL